MLETYNGMFIRPNTSDLQAVREVFEGGYENKTFKIEAGEHWLDIGAHIGSFTVFALNKGANVISFEPDSEHFDLLKKIQNLLHEISIN